VLAFAQIGHEGLGPGRARAELKAVYQLDECRSPAAQVYDGRANVMKQPGPPLELNLTPGPGELRRLSVRFMTPTELKGGGQLTEKPDFPVLFARVRDRISTLRALYQSGPLGIDFRAMGRRAAEVQLTRCGVRWRDAVRRSSKTGQAHSIGGFVGEADYEGNLTEFVPFLKAAEWTGVGRHTVWGKGAILVSPV